MPDWCTLRDAALLGLFSRSSHVREGLKCTTTQNFFKNITSSVKMLGVCVCVCVCVCVGGLALNTGYWVDPMHRVRTQSAWSILRNGSARNEICTVYQHWNSFHRGGVAINDQAVVGVGEQH
jgi:hypothetical protein